MLIFYELYSFQEIYTRNLHFINSLRVQTVAASFNEQFTVAIFISNQSRSDNKNSGLKKFMFKYAAKKMSGPNLRVYYESSFKAIDNVVRECAICGLQCEILFPAEGIKNMATFDGNLLTSQKSVVTHEIRIFWENYSFENIDLQITLHRHFKQTLPTLDWA